MGIKSIPGAIGRAFAVAPSTPADRVAILRDAFAKAIKDPEQIAEAQKAKIEMQFHFRRASAQRFQRDDESDAGNAEGDGKIHQGRELDLKRSVTTSSGVFLVDVLNGLDVGTEESGSAFAWNGSRSSNSSASPEVLDRYFFINRCTGILPCSKRGS